MVIGADVKNSLVARSVDEPTHDDVPTQAFSFTSTGLSYPSTESNGTGVTTGSRLRFPPTDHDTC